MSEMQLDEGTDRDDRILEEAQANLSQDLIENFTSLPFPIQLASAQAGMSKGVMHCFIVKKKALQDELLNITEIDPIKLATEYTIIRQQLVLVDEIIAFYTHLSDFFLQHTGQSPETSQQE